MILHKPDLLSQHVDFLLVFTHILLRLLDEELSQLARQTKPLTSSFYMLDLTLSASPTVMRAGDLSIAFLCMQFKGFRYNLLTIELACILEDILILY